MSCLEFVLLAIILAAIMIVRELRQEEEEHGPNDGTRDCVSSGHILLVCHGIHNRAMCRTNRVEPTNQE